MRLKRLLRLSIVLSAALYVGCSDAGNPETGPAAGGVPALTPRGAVSAFVPAAKPEKAPFAEFQNAQGKTVSLEDFKGKTVLLNLWATWCGPCKVEMPSLDALQARLGGADFQVVALSSDRAGKRAVDPYFENAGIKALSPYYDPKNAVGLAMGVTGLPTSVLIDAQGRELGRITGDAKWDSPDAVALVRQAMGK